MKHTIKEESIGAFLRDALLYPKASNSAVSGSGSSLLRSDYSFDGPLKEIHIRQDQGVDAGDIVVFEFNEHTPITAVKLDSKLTYKCVGYDSVSHKLIKQ